MQYILTQQHDATLTLTLNRPDALNALSLEVWRELETVLRQAHDDATVKVLVMTGAGRAFSAGGDIKQMSPDRTPIEQYERLLVINRVILDLYDFPKPTIAAVNGIAAGNGCSLALACDFVVAAEQAAFSMSFVRLGLVPDAGGTWLLPRLVGQRRAKELIMTARRLNAHEALEWGMISQVVSDGALAETAADLSRTLSNAPANALSLGKQLVQQATERSLAAALHDEALAQGQCVAHSNYREGVAAFLERRPAHFDQADAATPAPPPASH